MNIGDYVEIKTHISNFYGEKLGIITYINNGAIFPYGVSFLTTANDVEEFSSFEIYKITDKNLINKLNKILTFK